MAVHNNLLVVSLSLLLLLSAILETEAHSEGPQTSDQKDQCGMDCNTGSDWEWYKHSKCGKTKIKPLEQVFSKSLGIWPLCKCVYETKYVFVITAKSVHHTSFSILHLANYWHHNTQPYLYLCIFKCFW